MLKKEDRIKRRYGLWATVLLILIMFYFMPLKAASEEHFFPDYVREHPLFERGIRESFAKNCTLRKLEEREHGFSFGYLYEDEGKTTYIKGSVEAVMDFPQLTSQEEYLEYFLSLYPNLLSYSVQKQDSDSEYKDMGKYSMTIYEEKQSHTYIRLSEKWYLIQEKSLDFAPTHLGWRIKNHTGYEYYSDEVYYYEQDEKGLISKENKVDWSFKYRVDIGEEVPFVFHFETVDTEEGEFFPTYKLEAKVYRMGETEPFAAFMTEMSSAGYFNFTDFNCDGYLDVRALYFYGANGGTQKIHLWSPSKEEFVQGPSDMEYFGNYKLDQEKRLLQISVHGSAIDGGLTLYQWKNEMDYEIVRRFSYGGVFDQEKGTRGEVMGAAIRDYSRGKEEVLCDFHYEVKNDDHIPDEIWGLYYLDYHWKDTMVHPETGESCILYFGDEGYRIAEEEENSISPTAFEKKLYILGEDTRILNCLIIEDPVKLTNSSNLINSSTKEEIFWKDMDEDGKEELVIHFQDGSYVSYTQKELVAGNQNL